MLQSHIVNDNYHRRDIKSHVNIVLTREAVTHCYDIPVHKFEFTQNKIK